MQIELQVQLQVTVNVKIQVQDELKSGKPIHHYDRLIKGFISHVIFKGKIIYTERILLFYQKVQKTTKGSKKKFSTL